MLASEMISSRAWYVDGQKLVITWDSKPNATYAIDFSPTLTDWIEAEDLNSLFANRIDR